MKIEIAITFERESNNVLVKGGEVFEDFTDEELKKYNGLYRILNEKKQKEIKTTNKIKLNKT